MNENHELAIAVRNGFEAAGAHFHVGPAPVGQQGTLYGLACTVEGAGYDLQGNADAMVNTIMAQPGIDFTDPQALYTLGFESQVLPNGVLSLVMHFYKYTPLPQAEEEEAAAAAVAVEGS
jgi:hypothetical protein